MRKPWAAEVAGIKPDDEVVTIDGGAEIITAKATHEVQSTSSGLNLRCRDVYFRIGNKTRECR
jgi:hypothetical protein